MQTVYLILIFAVILVHQVIIFLKNRRIDPLSDNFLLDLTLMALFGFSYVFDYKKTVNMDLRLFLYLLSGILSLYAGMIIGQKNIRHKPIPRSKVSSLQHPLDPRVLKLMAFVWLGLMLVSFYIKYISQELGSISTSSLVDYAFKERTASYLAGGILSGNSWLENLARLFFLFPTIALFQQLLDKRKWLAGLILFSSMVIAQIFVFQTRYDLFMMFSLPFLYVHVRVRRFRSREVIIGLVAAAFVLSGLDLWRAEGLRELRLDRLLPQERILRDLNPTWSFYELYQMEKAGVLPYDYFHQYILSLATPIPRVIWRNKPITSFSPRYTQFIYGYALGERADYAVATFTVLGEGIAMLGWYGLIINCFLFGYFTGFIKRKYLADVGLSVTYAFFLLYLPLYFRGSFTDFIMGPVLIAAIMVYIIRGIATRHRSTNKSLKGLSASNSNMGHETNGDNEFSGKAKRT